MLRAEIFIGIGSNIENPQGQVIQAIQSLASLPNTQVIKVSSLYQTKPFGPVAQPDFINAVAQLSTTLKPIELLDALQQIELEQGRTREEHWGPRTLDLDILLYNREQISLPRLEIPHPGISQRDFVLVPLCEIAPQTTVIDELSASQLLDRLPADTKTCLEIVAPAPEAPPCS